MGLPCSLLCAKPRNDNNPGEAYFRQRSRCRVSYIWGRMVILSRAKDTRSTQQRGEKPVALSNIKGTVLEKGQWVKLPTVKE